MEPRLPTSQKWTPFPAEFVEKIQLTLSETFPEASQTGEFVVEGRIYPQEIVMRVGFLQKGRLKQDNFEASMDYSQKDKTQTAFKTIYTCLDAIGSSFGELFAAGEEEVEFPRSWEAFEFEIPAEATDTASEEAAEPTTAIVWLQYSTVNSRLEEEANRLLNSLDDKALVLEDQADEDALSHAIIDSELAEQAQKIIRRGGPSLN